MNKKRIGLVLMVLLLLSSISLFANGTTEKEGTAYGAKSVDWPIRPISLNVAAKAGGVTDIHARYITKAWQQPLGTSIAIVNNASDLVSYEMLAQAKPDGYTLLIQHDTFLCEVVTGATKIDPLSDLEIVAVLQNAGPTVVIAAPNAPYSNMSEMFAYAKDHPNEVSCAIATNGFTHFMWGAIQKLAGVKFKMVQAANGADKLTNVAGGFISLGNIDIASAKQYEQAGKVKVIGIIAGDDYKDAEDTPENWKSMQGQGYDFSFSSNFAIYAPKGTSKEILEKLNSTLKVLLTDADFSTEMTNMGAIACWNDLDQSKKILTDRMRTMKSISEELGISTK